MPKQEIAYDDYFQQVNKILSSIGLLLAAGRNFQVMDVGPVVVQEFVFVALLEHLPYFFVVNGDFVLRLGAPP